MWCCCMIVNWRCLLHVCPIASCLRSLSCPDRITPPFPAIFCAVMDHGDLLRECRLMLHAISSQISILVAGLQRLEGQQRHPQPPPPPAAPDGQPPLPPPPTSAPPSLPAPSVRSTHPTVPITLVAASNNRMEPAGHVNPVSDSASRERRRRRRSTPRGQSCPPWDLSSHAAQVAALTNPVMMTQSHAFSKTLSNSIHLCHAAFSAALHCDPFETGYSSNTVRNDKMQALLSCFSTSWTEMSFSLCSSPARALPLQVRASSAAVNQCRHTLQTLLIRPAFRLKSCLALHRLQHSHCVQAFKFVMA